MQYYFARTGLLDGKGAQLAKDRDGKRSMSGKENLEPCVVGSEELGVSALSLYDGASSSCAVSESGLDHSVMESPTDMQDTPEWPHSSEPPMLAPNVSTYKQRPSYTEPLPGIPVLRRELKEALQDACKVLEESQKDRASDEQAGEDSDGFYEIQGLHLLDIITLAIRAARNYYTAHSQPQKLFAIKSEKQIRADLYQVLEILKRMASRNFRGGVRVLELTGIITWIEGVDKLLQSEEQQEEREAAERASWTWREGEWTGREREREWLFLRSFDQDLPPLPQWPEESSPPNEFLRALQDGQRLIKLHNAFVVRSQHHFDEIKTWHVDVAKPYRIAENLRYWIKAAELRWDLKLSVPVSDIANIKADGASWVAFDDAIFKWSRRVRTELMEEWRQEAQSERRRPPELRVGVSDGDLESFVDR